MTKMHSYFERLFTLPQYIIPKRQLSNLIFYLARIKIYCVKQLFIRLFIKGFKVDLKDAQFSKIDDYESFNDFFTRPIKPIARPIANGKYVLVSPTDSKISQFGDINGQTLVQAKNHSYTLQALLAGDDEQIRWFENGQFITLYLSPKDYHRIHMPVTGTLLSTTYVPGQLFSVTERTSRVVDSLFARNERLISLFQADLGPFAIIMVGAVLVASIETVWSGIVNIKHPKKPCYRHYQQKNICLQKGSEMGRFNMGSTVILLLPKNTISWQDRVFVGKNVLMGSSLAQIK